MRGLQHAVAREVRGEHMNVKLSFEILEDERNLRVHSFGAILAILNPILGITEYTEF